MFGAFQISCSAAQGNCEMMKFHITLLESAFMEPFLFSPQMAALVKDYLLGIALSFLLVV